MRKLKILVGCEESQAVTKAFRELGHEAYSNDILPCSGGHPEWHLQMDVFEAIELMDWDLMVAFPECRFLTNAGIRHFNEERYGEKARDRKNKRLQAADFFMRLYNCKIPFVALENPVGYMNSSFRKPDQILQPYYFGEPHVKAICLWLKGLPVIQHQGGVKPDPVSVHHRKSGTSNKIGSIKKNYYSQGLKARDSVSRSKTFPNMAKAMAEQWSEFILTQQP